MSTNYESLSTKYFPRTFDDVFLPTSIRKKMESCMQADIFRLLLYSTPGTGKTSISRILSNDFETLYLSGSNSFSIDTMKSRVIPFSSNISARGKKKLVIIDEAENIRDDLQDGFKIILDKTKVSFIFITNEVNKINTAILSRTNKIPFDFSGQDLKEQKINFIRFAAQICEKENIKYTNDGISKLLQMLFPDFRQLLIVLQHFIDTETELNPANVVKMTAIGNTNEKLYKIITDNTIQEEALYQACSEFAGREKECFMSLGEPFFGWLNDQGKWDKTLMCAPRISKYSDMYVTSINKFVTFLACVVELKTLFR